MYTHEKFCVCETVTLPHMAGSDSYVYVHVHVLLCIYR